MKKKMAVKQRLFHGHLFAAFAQGPLPECVRLPGEAMGHGGGFGFSQIRPRIRMTRMIRGRTKVI